MIYGLVGKPGGGKSYEAVAYHIIPALKSGRKVVTNLPLNLEHFSSVFGKEILDLIEIRTEAKGSNTFQTKGITIGSGPKGKPFSSLECYTDDWRGENNLACLFVIDECHLVLRKGSTPVSINDWFSMHRHLGFDLLLITQNFRKVDNDICDMIELVYYVTKNTMLGTSKTYTKKVKDGLRGDVVNTEQRTYEKKYFPFYQSHTLSNSAVQEATAADVKGIYSHWTFKGAVILFILALIIAGSLVFKSDEKEKDLKKSLEKHKEMQTSLSGVKPLPVVLSVPTSASMATVPNQSKKVAEIDLLKKTTITHPFYKLNFHLSGSYSSDDLSTVIFAASQNGQKIGYLYLKDFALAGYDVKVLGNCLAELSYQDTFHDFVVCDSPTVGLVAATE